jgi:hypothetical protein
MPGMDTKTTVTVGVAGTLAINFVLALDSHPHPEQIRGDIDVDILTDAAIVNTFSGTPPAMILDSGYWNQGPR